MPFFRNKRPRKRVAKKGRIAVSDPRTAMSIRFQGLTVEDLEAVCAWEDVCRDALPRVVETFYDHILAFDEARAFLEARTSVPKQRPMLLKYLETLFSGVVDDDFVRARARLGAVHEKIGLSIHWFMAMFDVIRRGIVGAVVDAGASPQEVLAFADSFQRLLSVDIGLVVGVLYDEQAKLQAEVRRQQAATQSFIEAMSETAQDLAARDLTKRVPPGHGEEYDRIGTALNGAITELASSLSRIGDATSEVTTAVTQISSGSQTLAQMASEQASTLQSVVGRVNTMVEASRQNSLSAAEAAALGLRASTQAQTGFQGMKNLGAGIQEIKESCDRTAKVVSTIDEIAFQTNLLALNAAVEAARAGDAGKGFSVVADEVRALSIRCAEAARDTSALIQATIECSQRVVGESDSVFGNFEEIVREADSVAAVVGKIEGQSTTQASLGEEIHQSLTELNHATQETAANAEQSAAASEEVSSQAEVMRDIAQQFRLPKQERWHQMQAPWDGTPLNDQEDGHWPRLAAGDRGDGRF